MRLKQERLPEAEALLKRASQIDPKFAEAYVSLGSLQETQKNTAKAVEAYRQALQIQPQNTSAAAHLAKLFEASGDYKASLETLHRIPSASRPADLRVVELADLLGLKQLVKARVMVPAILSSSKTSEAPLACADQFLKYGLSEDALGILRTVRLRARPSAHYYVLLGRAQLQKKQFATAEESFQRALKLNPDSVEALRAVATFDGERGRWQEA